MKNLLTIIDMQYDFIMPDGLLTLNAPDIVPLANTFLNNHGARFDHILATRDEHVSGEYENCTYSDEAKHFPMHCQVGTPGHKYVIKTPKHTSWLAKKDNSMWHNASKLIGYPSNESVADIWHPYQWRVYVMGVASDICVKYAVDGFLSRGYETVILTDMCRGLNSEINAVAAQNWGKYMASRQLKLMTTSQFIQKQKGNIK